MIYLTIKYKDILYIMVKWWGTLNDYNILCDLNNICGSKLKIDLSSWNEMLKLKQCADNDFVKF